MDLDDERHFDEDMGYVPIQNFDYSALDHNPHHEEHDPVDAALQAFTKLLTWIFHDGMSNPEGVKIRALVCCWVFLKELRPQSLSQFARGYGMHKQSFGRWVEDFKQQFPDIRIVHMRINGQRNGHHHTRWPPYMESLRRFARLKKVLDAQPIKTWPDDGIDRLRADIEPIARDLWPERFQ